MGLWVRHRVDLQEADDPYSTEQAVCIVRWQMSMAIGLTLTAHPTPIDSQYFTRDIETRPAGQVYNRALEVVR